MGKLVMYHFIGQDMQVNAIHHEFGMTEFNEFHPLDGDDTGWGITRTTEFNKTYLDSGLNFVATKLS